MSTNAANNPTLIDITKNLGPDNQIARLAKLLTQTNSILMDMPFFQGNKLTGHEFLVQTSLPTVGHRRVNEGVQSSKTTEAKVQEECSHFEGRCTIDKLALRLSTTGDAYKTRQAMGFIEAMNQKMARVLFYGNRNSNVLEFDGLATRRNSTSGNKGLFTIDAGGSGSDNTSIYMVGWGENSIHGIYPQGSKAGLDVTTKLDQRITDANGLAYQADEILFEWDAGIAEIDYRYLVRIANIDVSDLIGRTSTQAIDAATSLIYKLIDAENIVPKDSGVRMVAYANRTVFAALQKIALDKSSNVLSIIEAKNQFGDGSTYEMRFGRTIIRCCDQILDTEAAVS